MKNISFILPLYNLEKYIIKCLESIALSKLPPSQYEVIVWDDGSSDNSAQIVKEYAKEHENIHLISCDNHGVSWVRNHALLEVRGEYVWFVDSDDQVCSESIDILVDKALDNKLDMLLFNWKPISEFGVVENFMLHPVKDSEIITGRDLYMSQQLSMAPWCYIYRKAFLIENNLSFPEDYKTCEDIQFNQKALWLAKKVKTAENVGYYYRQMASSATGGNADRLVKDHIRRISSEIEYFAPTKDWEFLTKVLYRNLREVNVWLSKVQNVNIYFKDIREALTAKIFVISPKYGSEYWMIKMMSACPNLLFAVQKCLKNIRNIFK